MTKWWTYRCAMEWRGAPNIFGWAWETGQRRLERHFQELCHHKNSNPSCQSRPEILSQAKFSLDEEYPSQPLWFGNIRFHNIVFMKPKSQRTLNFLFIKSVYDVAMTLQILKPCMHDGCSCLKWKDHWYIPGIIFQEHLHIVLILLKEKWQTEIWFRIFINDDAIVILLKPWSWGFILVSKREDH